MAASKKGRRRAGTGSPPVNTTGYGKGTSDRGMTGVGKAKPKRRGQRK